MVLAREGFERTADLRESMLKDRRKVFSDRIRQKDVAISEQTSLMATVSQEQRQKIQMVIDRLQLERQDLERQVLEYNQAPTLVPARYTCLHGNILLRLDRNSEAIAQYEEALKTDPGYGEAANNLASIYHVSGRNRKAMEVVTEAQKRGAKLHPELAKSIEAALARNP
jgi:Flp pilus assembly protein TadD